MIGTLGRYQILDVLGEGAMGIVYRAYDPMLDREVAVKELRLQDGLDRSVAGAAVDRFYTEARAAARLSHPCIVTVHDVGEDQGRVYLAMELLAGSDLARVIAEVGALDPGQAHPVLVQIAEALAAAHSQGVVHRDIKPDNCFWLPDGRVKVGDFGIARVGAEARGTRAGTVLGSPPYMSPEQVRGEDVTPAADVFSWGATAFELVAGMPPFGADDIYSVMYRVVNEEPPDLRSLVPSMHPSLAAIIHRALAKSPRDRYGDGGDLAIDLQAGAVPPSPTAGSRGGSHNMLERSFRRVAEVLQSPQPFSYQDDTQGLTYTCPACDAGCEQGDLYCQACGVALTWEAT